MKGFKILIKNLICRSITYISLGFLMTAAGIISIHFFLLAIPFGIGLDLLYLYFSDRLYEHACINKRRVAGLILSLIVFVNLSSGFTYKNAKRSIPVLTYHRVNNETLRSAVPTITPKAFERQMEFLQRHGYTTISSEDLNRYYKGEKIRLPKKPIVITFDDGWKDNYTNAYPILKKYNMKATIFLVTGRMGSNNYLSWDMAKSMEKNGISFGGHTRHHTNLKKYNKQEDYTEIKESYDDIVKNLGIKPKSFCYPYGGGDIYPSIQKLVKQSGYDIAFASNNFGINMSNVNPYAVRRILLPRFRIFHSPELIFLAW